MPITVVQEPPATIVVRSPGPQGPAATGSFVPVEAGENLGGGRFLAIAEDGTAVYADASAGVAATGFTRDAVSVGETVTFRAGSGLLTGLSGLTPGATYFLSGVTPGMFTTTPPSTGLVQPVGSAISEDTLAVLIEPAVEIV